MNTLTQTIDTTLFKDFTPLSALDDHILEKLAQQATVQRIQAGKYLFERGDTTPKTLFLLKGEVELRSPVFPTQKVNAGSDAGRYPLAHSFPRQFTALAISEVHILVLSLDILEIMQLDSANDQPKADGASHTWKTQWLNSPMLRNLPAANKKALISKMEEIKVRAGEVIIHQEEPADSYFVIKKGRCSVSRRPAPGARDIKLAELTEGQGFGEEALITNVARNASVTMLSNGCLLRLSKRDFISLFARPLLHHLPFQNAIELVEQGAVLIDVRAPEEFETDGLIGSLNMPLPVLRLKANRLHSDCTYIVYSNTGHFSSVAAFLLIQQGLKAYILQGGLSTAPKYRMKRGAFNHHDSEIQDAAAQSKTIVSFPHTDVAQQSSTFSSEYNNDTSKNQQQSNVDWNLISDDVLWRTTIGYRNDASVEAVISAQPAEEMHSQPQTDTTLQGFDDIKFFTTGNSIKDIKLGDTHDSQPVAGYSEIEDSRTNKLTRTSAVKHTDSHNWKNKSNLHFSRRSTLALVIIFSTLAVGGSGYYYFTKGDITNKLEKGSPMLFEQQRKLDAKVSRLLNAIEAMPTLRKNTEEPNNPAETNTASAPLAHDARADGTANVTTQGKILRKK